ncbi:MAG TPA: N-acetylmuramoyl-L-alanine amidase [Steroidobacteraceae bacterium]|nr:N-acetylmuramoyl-L-alanine amidase [Steroidobacteraceae bacterium]
MRHALGWAVAPLLTLGVFLALPSIAQASGATARLQRVSLSSGPSDATLTLELSAPVQAHTLRLSAPERLVIDLPQTRRRGALPALGGDSLVAAVRSGRPDDHTLRLVLELRAPSILKMRWQRRGNGAQLRVELTRAPGAQTFMTPAASASAPVGHTPTLSAALLQALPAAHAPRTSRDVIIAVDAGHGGVDPGATGPDGTREKNVTLAIARALAAHIDAAPGMHAVLTRDGDYFVPLRDRMERARAAHADLFVSIHADSVRDHGVEGSSVYILSERGASSEAARRLADQQNAADLAGGISLAAQAPELRSVLMDLSQNASMAQSGEAAQDVLGALDRVGAVRKREVQQAAFVVLKSPDVPSMLIETAYISNPGEERRLRDPIEQQRLAFAIFNGIADYIRQYPPQGTLFARTHSDPASGAAKNAS